ncbi:MAG: hypothetical protein IPK60_13600 [Sandaracinaceae bacterium]|nr:hypothetical protein [Sandaracinaceae bacterium]
MAHAYELDAFTHDPSDPKEWMWSNRVAERSSFRITSFDVESDSGIVSIRIPAIPASVLKSIPWLNEISEELFSTNSAARAVLGEHQLQLPAHDVERDRNWPRYKARTYVVREGDRVAVLGELRVGEAGSPAEQHKTLVGTDAHPLTLALQR